MTFWNDIYELRRQNLIPRQWRRKHIMPFLKGKYEDSTIWTVPSNQSVSKDRKVQGNYVQRGMEPKAYRIAPGLFELIDEPSSPYLESSLNRSQTQPHSSRKANSTKNHSSIRLPGNIARELGLDGPLTVERTSEGVLLRSTKLSWEETARQMAESEEDWSVFDVTVADGLNGNH